VLLQDIRNIAAIKSVTNVFFVVIIFYS
jgi:hypothetical protein